MSKGENLVYGTRIGIVSSVPIRVREALRIRYLLAKFGPGSPEAVEFFRVNPLLSKTGADLGTRVETRGFAFPELEFGVRGLPL